MDKTKAEIKKFKKLEQEAHNGTAETGYYTDEFEYCLGRFAEDLCSAGLGVHASGAISKA